MFSVQFTTLHKVALLVALPVSGVLLYFLLRNNDEDDYMPQDRVVTSRHRVIEVNVPKHAAGAIIGTQGSQIKQIQDTTGCRVNFKDDVVEGATERVVVIRGTDEQAQQAELMIRKIVADIPPIIEETIYVPRRTLGRIIGKGGETVRKMSRITKAKILIDRDEQNSKGDMRDITLRGVPLAVANAKDMIEDLLQEEEVHRAKVALQQANRQQRNRGHSRPYNTDKNDSANHTVPHGDAGYTESSSQSSNQAATSDIFNYSGRSATWPSHIKDFIELYVSAVEHPGHFWVQLINAESTKLDRLTDNMTKYYSMQAKCHRPPDYKVGDVVAAPFAGEQGFFRARVLEVLNHKIDLYYLDYGDSEIVDKSEVYPIRNDFLALPFQAFECTLAQVEPTDTEWSESAIIAFEDLSHVAKWKVVMMKHLGYEQTDFGMFPSIQLIDTNGPEDIDVAVELVKQGFGKYKTPKTTEECEKETEVCNNTPKITEGAKESENCNKDQNSEACGQIACLRSPSLQKVKPNSKDNTIIERQTKFTSLSPIQVELNSEEGMAATSNINKQSNSTKKTAFFDSLFRLDNFLGILSNIEGKQNDFAKSNDVSGKAEDASDIDENSSYDIISSTECIHPNVEPPRLRRRRKTQKQRPRIKLYENISDVDTCDDENQNNITEELSGNFTRLHKDCIDNNVQSDQCNNNKCVNQPQNNSITKTTTDDEKLETKGLFQSADNKLFICDAPTNVLNERLVNRNHQNMETECTPFVNSIKTNDISNLNCKPADNNFPILNSVASLKSDTDKSVDSGCQECGVLTEVTEELVQLEYAKPVCNKSNLNHCNELESQVSVNSIEEYVNIELLNCSDKTNMEVKVIDNVDGDIETVKTIMKEDVNGNDGSVIQQSSMTEEKCSEQKSLIEGNNSGQSSKFEECFNSFVSDTGLDISNAIVKQLVNEVLAVEIQKEIRFRLANELSRSLFNEVVDDITRDILETVYLSEMSKKIAKEIASKLCKEVMGDLSSDVAYQVYTDRISGDLIYEIALELSYEVVVELSNQIVEETYSEFVKDKTEVEVTGDYGIERLKSHTLLEKTHEQMCTETVLNLTGQGKTDGLKHEYDKHMGSINDTQINKENYNEEYSVKKTLGNLPVDTLVDTNIEVNTNTDKMSIGDIDKVSDLISSKYGDVSDVESTYSEDSLYSGVTNTPESVTSQMDDCNNYINSDADTDDDTTLNIEYSKIDISDLDENLGKEGCNKVTLCSETFMQLDIVSSNGVNTSVNNVNNGVVFVETGFKPSSPRSLEMRVKSQEKKVIHLFDKCPIFSKTPLSDCETAIMDDVEGSETAILVDVEDTQCETNESLIEHEELMQFEAVERSVMEGEVQNDNEKTPTNERTNPFCTDSKSMEDEFAKCSKINENYSEDVKTPTNCDEKQMYGDTTTSANECYRSNPLWNNVIESTSIVESPDFDHSSNSQCIGDFCSKDIDIMHDSLNEDFRSDSIVKNYITMEYGHNVDNSSNILSEVASSKSGDDDIDSCSEQSDIDKESLYSNDSLNHDDVTENTLEETSESIINHFDSLIEACQSGLINPCTVEEQMAIANSLASTYSHHHMVKIHELPDVVKCDPNLEAFMDFAAQTELIPAAAEVSVVSSVMYDSLEDVNQYLIRNDNKNDIILNQNCDCSDSLYDTPEEEHNDNKGSQQVHDNTTDDTLLEDSLEDLPQDINDDESIKFARSLVNDVHFFNHPDMMPPPNVHYVESNDRAYKVGSDMCESDQIQTNKESNPAKIILSDDDDSSQNEILEDSIEDCVEVLFPENIKFIDESDDDISIESEVPLRCSTPLNNVDPKVLQLLDMEEGNFNISNNNNSVNKTEGRTCIYNTIDLEIENECTGGEPVVCYCTLLGDLDSSNTSLCPGDRSVKSDTILCNSDNGDVRPKKAQDHDIQMNVKLLKSSLKKRKHLKHCPNKVKKRVHFCDSSSELVLSPTDSSDSDDSLISATYHVLPYACVQNINGEDVWTPAVLARFDEDETQL